MAGGGAAGAEGSGIWGASFGHSSSQVATSVYGSRSSTGAESSEDYRWEKCASEGPVPTLWTRSPRPRPSRSEADVGKEGRNTIHEVEKRQAKSGAHKKNLCLMSHHL